MAAAARHRWNEFPTREALAAALAAAVAGALEAAIAKRGGALLAVSGGTTPVRLFERLSQTALDWKNVTVLLVDERFVPPSSPRSNATLVRDHLLKGRAAAARFAGLYHEAATVEEAAERAAAAVAALPLPIDFCILGMGTDGHTASFFPDAENLDALLDPRTAAAVLPVCAPSAPEPRLTLTLPLLAGARQLALHIEGAAKRAAFEAAMAKGTGMGVEKPIRAVIDASPRPVEVFWAP